MERLKGSEGGLGMCIKIGFTFQYGEIKSNIRVVKRYKKEKFTFQYGEIKSHHL